MDDLEQVEEDIDVLYRLIETIEQQVTDIGEGLGYLLWDLYYATKSGKNADAERATFLLAQEWLEMDYSQEVMAATHDIYNHPED